MGSTVNINWGWLAQVATALAGVAGIVITPVYGSGLAGEVQALLLGLSTVLVGLPTYHSGSVMAAKMKLKAVTDAQAANPGATFHVHL